MKLAKLSLAAIVAAGAMTTFASAAPLEEAIKGVDLSGIARYRIDMNDKGSEDHRFSGAFTFTVPVADGLKSVLTLRYDDANNAKDNAAEPDNTFGVSRAYFSYAVNDFVVNVGKQGIATPWTYDNPFDGQIGNGVLALYKGVEGWTFAGAGFVNLGVASTQYTGSKFAALGDKENLYAAAAIGSFGPVNAQFWAARMTHVFDYSAFAELSTKYEGFTLKAQANQLKLADAGPGVEDTGLFYAVEGGFSYEGISLKAGYMKNDKDQPIYALANDHKMIREGKRIYGHNVNLADAKTYFGKVAYKFDKYSVGAAYIKTKVSDSSVGAADNSFKKGDEWYVEAGYAYSKNFSLYTYYADYDRTNRVGEVEAKRLRVEGVYKF